MLALALAGCGAAAPVEAPPVPAEEAPAPIATERLAPEGSRLTLDVPAGLTRVRHALRWRGEGLQVVVADAQVQPGEERAIAEAYLAQLARRHAGEVSHRPVALAGARGYEATIRGETRVRTMMVWAEGAISRVTVIHDPTRALEVERLLESVRFEPSRAVDPRPALQLALAVPEGMGVVPVTNEQLLLRVVDEAGRAAHAVGFPHPEPVVDVAVVPYPDGGRPPNDVTRGRLLGSRFAGLELGMPQVTAIAGRMQGFAIVTTTPVEGVELTLYGAYLETDDAVVLVRGSVATADAERWLPRFAEMTLSLEAAL